MSKPRLITALSLAAFLRWLATGHVTAAVGGTTIIIPALALLSAAVIATAAGIVAVIAYRLRADRTTAAAYPAEADAATASATPGAAGDLAAALGAVRSDLSGTHYRLGGAR